MNKVAGILKKHFAMIGKYLKEEIQHVNTIRPVPNISRKTRMVQKTNGKEMNTSRSMKNYLDISALRTVKQANSLTNSSTVQQFNKKCR